MKNMKRKLISTQWRNGTRHTGTSYKNYRYRNGTNLPVPEDVKKSKKIITCEKHWSKPEECPVAPDPQKKPLVIGPDPQHRTHGSTTVSHTGTCQKQRIQEVKMKKSKQEDWKRRSRYKIKANYRYNPTKRNTRLTGTLAIKVYRYR
jgi:hypothetical protein